MKILLTGSSGRIGRAIFVRLCAEHRIIGIDSAPSSTTQIVASIEDSALLRRALDGIDAVIHVAALHAPHVAFFDDARFEAINVRATKTLAALAVEAGVKTFIFTSTTALYGAVDTALPGARWITEHTPPVPRTIYHHSKLRAEAALREIAESSTLAVNVIRMSRCFPEPAPLMSTYRLHRGVDARDVADAHAKALLLNAPGYRCFLVSGATPFLPEDAAALACNAAAVIELRCPELALAFQRRSWTLPQTIDRVYCPEHTIRALNWQPQYGYNEVLAQLDRRSAEVLPVRSPSRHRWSRNSI